MSVIPALRRRLRQEEHEFEAGLSYIVRLCQKTTKKGK
jgi:hypothetical protein